MTRAREAARLIGNNTFRLDSNNAVGFNSTTPDAMFDINRGLTVAGVSTFTGNVTMSGDLTVQGTTTTLDTIVQEVDLMNIQANSSTPGLGVTQSGAGSLAAFYDGTSEVVTVTSGGNIRLPDSTASSVGRIEIGNSQDLQLFHNGTHSYIDDSGTGNLYIRSSSFRVQKYTGEECARFNADGAVELYYDNSKKLETKSDGIDVTGEVQCDSLDVDGVADITGNVTLHANLDLQDNDKILLGTGDDFELYHDGTDNVIATDGPNIRIGTTGETFAKFNNNGSVELYRDNVKTFETTASGINVKGPEGGETNLELHADEGDDNIDKFRFNVSNSGPFKIQNVASGGWETNIECNGNGNVELYFNDSKKLETTSGGVDITGTLNASGVITAEAGAVAEIGTLNDGATVTPDLSTHCNFTITLGGNRTLANPSAGVTAGQSGSIFVVQDGTGGRSFNSFGSYWDFIGGTVPTFTSTAGAVDRIDYIVRSSTKIHAVFTANYS